MVTIDGKRTVAGEFFQLDPERPTVLIVGGSQGALSINRCIEGMLPDLKKNKVQMIWQTGRNFRQQAAEACERHGILDIRVEDFIQRMDLAYALADVVISRAGAIAIAELSLVRKPVIFIPLPTAAEDHQMKNAMRLAEKGAAMVIPDREAAFALPGMLGNLLQYPSKRRSLSDAIGQFGIADADKRIAEEVIHLIDK
jgi:UDP-N-acetylglucosamine--N-acetylmuramyl-(pentapeptide) pyrophosphoryl-undecaprenol N-acetylglucosamine transferase